MNLTCFSLNCSLLWFSFMFIFERATRRRSWSFSASWYVVPSPKTSMSSAMHNTTSSLELTWGAFEIPRGRLICQMGGGAIGIFHRTCALLSWVMILHQGVRVGNPLRRQLVRNIWRGRVCGVVQAVLAFGILVWGYLYWRFGSGQCRFLSSLVSL